jgi:hypothetical protein
MLDTISFIASKLGSIESPWAIVGSSNLYVRGIADRANDIDIITDEKGVEEIYQTIQGDKNFSFERTIHENVSSVFFSTVINDILIEIMGDPHNYSNGKWVPNLLWTGAVEKFDISDASVFLTNIEYELKINTLLGNQKRVQLIQRYISKQGNQFL